MSEPVFVRQIGGAPGVTNCGRSRWMTARGFQRMLAPTALTARTIERRDTKARGGSLLSLPTASNPGSRQWPRGCNDAFRP